MTTHISAIIIAQDEDQRIATAVKSCRSFASEILVIDGGSQDDTVAVAKRAGARVLVNLWPGYAEQRQYGDRCSTNDWIFFIDADEEVDPDLATFLVEWKNLSHDPHEAFAFYRIGDFLGRWLHTAKEKKVRLYNRNSYRIRDALVHETPNVPEDRVQFVDGIIWHRGFRSISDHVDRFNRYTTLESQADVSNSREFSLIRFLTRPPARFAQQYIYHQLFRYGRAGLAVAYLWLIYEVLRELKLLELQCRLRFRDVAARKNGFEARRPRGASSARSGDASAQAELLRSTGENEPRS
jgi:glycosyltransferase involved in cell wall biosynthesis